MAAIVDDVERWTSGRLVELVPGSKRDWWRDAIIPDLVTRRVLRPLRRGWIGSRSEILSALMGDRS